MKKNWNIGKEFIYYQTEKEFKELKHQKRI